MSPPIISSYRKVAAHARDTWSHDIFVAAHSAVTRRREVQTLPRSNCRLHNLSCPRLPKGTLVSPWREHVSEKLDTNIWTGRGSADQNCVGGQITHARDESFYQFSLDLKYQCSHASRSERSRRSKLSNETIHFYTVFTAQLGGVIPIRFQVNTVNEYSGWRLLRQGAHMSNQITMLRI